MLPSAIAHTAGGDRPEPVRPSPRPPPGAQVPVLSHSTPPPPPGPSLVVDVFPAHNLVDDPVEHVEDEEGHGEADAGYLVDLLGPLDEEFPHLLRGLGWRWRRVGRAVVVSAFDRDAILGLQAGWAHPVGREVEAALSGLVLLE